MSDVTENAVPDIDLIERLGRLGSDIDRELEATIDPDLVDAVLTAITAPPAGTSHRSWAVAASVLVIVALGVVIVPESRQAVARWFGIDGVEIEVEPSLALPPPVDVADVVGPGESRVVDVDGREILVSAIDATFDGGLITKTVGGSDQLQQVDVGGSPGLWVAGVSHEVLYRVPDSEVDVEVVVERVAANTLLWNDGDVLYRVEGFDRLADALDFATGGIGPPASED